MTKGRVALTLAAVTWDGQSRRLSAIFISLGGPKAHDSSSRDDKVEGGGPRWHEWRWMDRVEKKLIWTSLRRTRQGRLLRWVR